MRRPVSQWLSPNLADVITAVRPAARIGQDGGAAPRWIRHAVGGYPGQPTYQFSVFVPPRIPHCASTFRMYLWHCDIDGSCPRTKSPISAPEHMERRAYFTTGQLAAAGWVFTQHSTGWRGRAFGLRRLASRRRSAMYAATAQRESLVMLVEALVFDAVRWRHERGRDDKGSNKGQDP